MNIAGSGSGSVPKCHGSATLACTMYIVYNLQQYVEIVYILIIPDKFLKLQIKIKNFLLHFPIKMLGNFLPDELHPGTPSFS
jgi:hypothetical protein